MLGKVLNRQLFSIFSSQLTEHKQANGNKYDKHEGQYDNQLPDGIPGTLGLSETEGNLIELTTAIDTPATGVFGAGAHFPIVYNLQIQYNYGIEE